VTNHAERLRRRDVPRAKYTKPPGPLPAIEQIQRSNFRFRSDQWHNLTKLLPCKLAGLGVPPEAAATLPEKVKTIADWVIQITEEAINSYLTVAALISEGQNNPANVRAALSRLRQALKPFVGGSVDNETANIVPVNLYAELAARDQEITHLRLAPVRQRTLGMLCQWIEVIVRCFASANGETVSGEQMLHYVNSALNFAGIKHPNIRKHRNRLAALVFPKN
jgi:hypothetical protein